jgi:hypothetical protein
VGFLACLVAAVVLIILIQPPPPAAVVLVGADYAENLLVPHNIPGWQGILGLEKVSKTPPRWSIFTPASLQLIRPPQILDQADQWDRLIKDLRKTGFRQETILFVVELHGVSHPGGAYLIPGKLARPDEERERLDLKHVIKTMGDLPKEKTKILVLEGAQVPADWRLGMLHNDFARRLEELEPEIREVHNLWVLSGCDVDQRCWASEGLGRTVFSHYIIEALRGKAAGGDRRLNLDALYDYVQKSVRDWVWNARGAIQEPVLLPRTKGVRGAGTEAEGAVKGEAAEKVARRPAKKVFLASVETVPDAEPPPAPDLDKLRQVWQEFHRLDALVPHPAVYSPRRWRQYKAELVRYEELHRAGAAARAGALRESINALASALDTERLLNLRASIENTLAMSAVTGRRVETPSVASGEPFRRFWQAPRGPAALKAWDALKAADGSDAATHPSLRIRLDEFLILRAVRDPPRNLESVAEKLLVTHARSDYPQPAEAHFLRMLALWPRSQARRAPELGGLIGQSLSVRMLAERAVLGLPATGGGRAHRYSEQVHPWIKTLIEKADEQRRIGEDLLFSSERTAWARSEQALKQAELTYRDATLRAETIRAALAARDRALATLPDYSRWLAHRGDDEIHDDLTSKVQELWDAAHRLTARLEKPGDDVDLGPLARFSKSLTQGLEHLVQRFETARARQDWEAAAAAAAVPFPDKEDLAMRAALWVRLDNIRLNDREVADPSKAQSVSLKDEDRRREAKQVRRRARIQGLMALAALGASWFDDPEAFRSAEVGDFASTAKLVQRAVESDEQWTRTGWLDLAVAGDRIGRRWRGMDPEIDRLVKEEGGITDFRGFQGRLTRADRLGRQIDGSAPRLEESAHEATTRLRETRVHDLLLAMADRAWLDHWYDEDPNPPTPPYYKAVGSRFIDDADKLISQSPLVRAARERLNQPGQLAIEGQPSLVLTSEPAAGLRYRVIAPRTVPPGIPVIKPVPGRFLELEGETSGFRSVAPDSGSGAIEFTVSSPLIRRAEIDPALNRPRIEVTSLKIEGSFRGQPLARTTEVQVHPVPDTVAIGPLPAAPPEASIAVRADKEIIRRFGAGTGSIAIVLDCSGSMLDLTPNGRTKFDEAKKALAVVLALVPQGTTVSLWTFSQLPEGVNQIFEGDPIAAEPELTIRPLRTPAAWDLNQLDDLARKLDQLRPYLGTPLVQAMWKAADTDLRQAQGLKTLLVLTDGMDTRFAANRKFNPDNLSIPKFFAKSFKPLGIGVNMIFFTPAGDKKEIANAEANFTPALKGLEPPGSFVKAANLAQLIERLTRAIKQKLTCQILKPDLTPVDEEPLSVTGPGDADRWWTRGLRPGIYTLRVHAGQSYDQEIDLKEGDRIVVELVDGPGGGIAFRRALYSDSEQFQGRPKAEQGGWRLAVRANRRLRQGQDERLQVLAALERMTEKAGPERLQQVRPRLAWFRLGAQDYEQPEAAFAVRWHERIFYPGPVWQFDVPRWVKDPGGEGLAVPILKAWWRDPETRLLPAGVFRLDSPGLVQGLPREVQVEGDKMVLIESLGVEDHYIEDRPGEPPQVKSCLVVRLAFPSKDSPYLVDPAGIAGVETVGYEHRLFTRAGKYTGLFWPVNLPQFQKLSSLSLIALDAFRDEAEKQKHAVEIRLSRPGTEDQLPSPPEALLKGN